MPQHSSEVSALIADINDIVARLKYIANRLQRIEEQRRKAAKKQLKP